MFWLEGEMITHARRRIDILVDQPLLRKVTRELNTLGVRGYTVFQSIGGRGEGGAWQPDQISDAAAKVMIMVVASDDVAQRLIDHFAPHLADYGMVLYVSTVEVIRAEKY
jgi:nitrogen regulatory protein PII